jgi:hypothetical protein
MASITVSFAYRPVRIGFVVRSGFIEDLTRVSTVCTQLWGGIFNVVLPVSDEASFGSASELARRYGVDYLHPITPTDVTEAFVEAESQRIPTFHFSGSDPLLDTSVAGGRIFAYQDMTAPLRAHWWREARHGGGPQGVEPVWPPDDPLSVMYAVSFGRYPAADEGLPSTREAFLQSVYALEWDLGHENPPSPPFDATFPITTTALGLNSVGWRGRDSLYSGAILGDPSSFDDLTRFWNLRASGFKIVFLPAKGGEHVRRWIASKLAEERQSTEHFAPSVTVLGRIASKEDLEKRQLEVADLLPEAGEVGISPMRDVLDDPYVGGPAPQTGRRTILASLEERFGQVGLIAHLPELPFQDAESWDERSSQLLIWSLEPHGRGDLEGWTFELPFVRELNEWYSRQMTPANPFELRVQPEGFDLIRRAYDRSAEVWPLHERTLVSQLFKRASVAISPSIPGQLADRIVAALGGMRGTTFLRIRGVRRLLAKQVARTGIQFNHAAELVRDRQGAKASFDLFRAQFYWREVTPEGVVTFLLNRGVFRPGLEVTCPECQLRPVIEADAIATELTCPLCGANFPSAPRLRKAKWVYQLSGVFRREGGPEGAVPSLLAMGEILRSADVSGRNVMLTAHALEGDGLRCESDFIYLELDRYGRPSICIGECKDWDAIDSKDVDNLVQVRNAIRESGSECYVAFSTMRESFSDAEVALFRGLAEQFSREEPIRRVLNEPTEAAPPILFTARELEAEPILRPATAGAPHEYPHGLRDLAENSAAVYLRIDTNGEPQGGDLSRGPTA